MGPSAGLLSARHAFFGGGNHFRRVASFIRHDPAGPSKIFKNGHQVSALLQMVPSTVIGS